MMGSRTAALVEAAVAGTRATRSSTISPPPRPPVPSSAACATTCYLMAQAVVVGVRALPRGEGPNPSLPSEGYHRSRSSRLGPEKEGGISLPSEVVAHDVD